MFEKSERMTAKDRDFSRSLKVRDVIAFQNSINEGDYVGFGKYRVKILRKFPHFAVTNKGNLMWVDIFFRSLGKLPKRDGYLYVSPGGRA